MIFASCGHKVEHISHLWDCTVKPFGRDGAPALEYTSLCKECYDWHVKEELVLFNEAEEDEYILGK
jgi:hypothetical protein